MRLYRFHDRTWWLPDTARDVNVAYHISHFGERPLAGHAVMGLPDKFLAPPYYFYFLGGIMATLRDPLDILLLHAIAEGLMVLVMIYIGTKLFNPETGLMAGLLYAVQAVLVDSTVGLWSVYVAIEFFYLGIALILMGRKRWLGIHLLGYATLVFAVTVHLSVLAAIPAILIADTWEKRRWWRTLFFILLFGDAVLLAHMPVIITLGMNGFLSVVKPARTLGFSPETATGTLNAIQLWIRSMYATPENIVIACASLAALVGLSGVRILKKTVFPVTALLSFISISFLKRGPANDWYYHLAIHAVILISAYFVASALRTTGIKKAAALICTGFLLYASSNRLSALTRGADQITPWREMAEKVLTYAHTHPEVGMDRTEIWVGDQDNEYGFGSSLLWYFMERQTGRQFSQTVANGNSLEWKNQKKNLLVVCRDYGESHGCNPSPPDPGRNRFRVIPVPITHPTFSVWLVDQDPAANGHGNPVPDTIVARQNEYHE